MSRIGALHEYQLRHLLKTQDVLSLGSNRSLFLPVNSSVISQDALMSLDAFMNTAPGTGLGIQSFSILVAQMHNVQRWVTLTFKVPQMNPTSLRHSGRYLPSCYGLSYSSSILEKIITIQEFYLCVCVLEILFLFYILYEYDGIINCSLCKQYFTTSHIAIRG